MDLPLISPPVRAATPAALQSTARMRTQQQVDDGLSASDLHDRFFSGAGPTDLMQLLGTVDDRITEINGGGSSLCFDAAPVDVTITPAGQSVVLPAQCARSFGSDGFMQFAVVAGVTSIYVSVGQARFAAIITPSADATDYAVDAWYGVGYSNATSCGAFDGCSYGLTELHADASSKAFELATAGIGEGYCGVQMQSDGTSIYAIGSPDMGMTCRDASTLCVAASDLTMPGACAASPAMQLTAIGRHAGMGEHEFGASAYPAMPNITLDGTDTDDLHFGPSAPSAGVESMDDKKDSGSGTGK